MLGAYRSIDGDVRTSENGPVMRLVTFLVSFVVAVLLLGARPAYADGAAATDTSFETPRKALEVFLQSAKKDDFARAADALDLHLVPAAQRKTKGPEIAEELYVALSRAVWIDPDAVPDDARLKADEKTYRITTVPLAGRDVPITLTSATTATQKDPRWSISAATIALAPQLYDQYGPGPIESRLPASLAEPRLAGLRVWQWVGLVVAVGLGYILGRLVAAGVLFFARRLAARTKAKWDDELVEKLRRPTRLFIGLVAFRLLLEPLSLSAGAIKVTETLLKVAFIAVLGMALMRLVVVIAHSIELHAIEGSNDSVTGAMRARGVTTQVRMLQRVINIGIGILTIALALIQFDTVRNVGVSLLASAGLAGVVFGFAAQRTLGSLVAGIQLSATQLVRIGDEVVVEKEFGTIEEITLTYVVVKIWDERRLVVPMTRFLDQPFENWTRTSTTLHGTVFLHADAALPVNAVRKELERLLAEDKRWDGRTRNVQVTDSTDRAVVVRLLVSANSSGALSDLRSALREKMYAWLAAYEGGKYLVRRRTEDETIPLPANVRSPVT